MLAVVGEALAQLVEVGHDDEVQHQLAPGGVALHLVRGVDFSPLAVQRVHLAHDAPGAGAGAVGGRDAGVRHGSALLCSWSAPGLAASRSPRDFSPGGGGSRSCGGAGAGAGAGRVCSQSVRQAGECVLCCAVLAEAICVGA